MNIAGFGNLFACYCAFDPVGGRWHGSKVIPLLLCLCFHVGMRGSIQFDSAINTCKVGFPSLASSLFVRGLSWSTAVQGMFLSHPPAPIILVRECSDWD